jgi:hypothetical protein
MISQRRDENEPGIVARLQKLGYHVSKMDRLAGFDLLAVRGGRTRIIEIKNPRTHWKLTDREVATKKSIEERGGIYEVILYASEISE